MFVDREDRRISGFGGKGVRIGKEELLLGSLTIFPDLLPSHQ